MAGFVIESPVWRLELEARSQDDLVRIVEDIADDCRGGCPRRTGAMRASIHTVFEPGIGYVNVGTDHWAPIEYGSVEHEIRPRNPSGALAFFWLKAGRNVVFKSVQHPGNPANPFMRPSLYRRRRPHKPSAP